MPQPDRPATPIVSPCRIVRLSAIEGPLEPAVARLVVDPQPLGDEQRHRPSMPRLASVDRPERAVDRLVEEPEQVADPQAALVRLVDEAMDLIERAPSH